MRQPRSTVTVDERAWLALKMASVRLRTSILETVTRLCQGDAEAIREIRRSYDEVGE